MRVAIVVMLVARLASADSGSPTDLFAEGQRRYTAGAYDAAAALFVRAYALQPDPAYLFNAAQAFRNANRCTKAHEYYTKFLAAVPGAPNAGEIREHLATLEPCAKAEAAKQEPPAPPKQENIVAPPRPETAPGRGKRIAGLASIGVGAVALAGGVFFTARVGKHERSANGLCVRGLDGTCPWSAAQSDRLAQYDSLAARDRTRAIASFAIGGVAVAGGIALYMLGRSAHTEGVAIVPTTDGVMAAFARAF